MRLTKIKVAGFKSFADATSVGFPSNLTGVVGPNGCGKSNIIDAVRWVMGELSAKHLRGDSMIDAGIHVQLSSTLRDIASYRLTVQPLGRFPVVYVEQVQRGGWRRSAKRAFDLAASVVALLVTSPLLLACAVAIKNV